MSDLQTMSAQQFSASFDYLVTGYSLGESFGYATGYEAGYEARLEDVRAAILAEIQASPAIINPGPRFDELCELRGDYARARRTRQRWQQTGFIPT